MKRYIPLILLTGLAATTNDSTCEPPNVNATGSASVPGLQVPGTSYGGGTWTFHISQRQELKNDSTYSMWHSMWVTTDPALNASDIDAPFTGCITTLGYLAQIVDAKTSTGTAGDCSGIFDNNCIAALIGNTNSSASANSGRTVGIKDCPNAPNRFEMPASCSKYQHYLSGTTTGQFIVPTSGRVNTTDSGICHPRYAEGGNPTSAVTNYTLYDNALRTVYPIIVSGWKANTTQNASEIWSDVRLMCIRADTVKAGSRNPNDTSSSGSSGGSSGSNGNAAIVVRPLAGATLALVLGFSAMLLL